jgi:hypothetical protein
MAQPLPELLWAMTCRQLLLEARLAGIWIPVNAEFLNFFDKIVKRA